MIAMRRAMVSIPFHQIMRSTVPVFTILIYRICYSRTYSTATYLSLIPLILGVGLATYGDYYFSTLGFVLTLLGVVLAALKVCIPSPLSMLAQQCSDNPRPGANTLTMP